MSFFDEMTASEHIEGAYEGWREYRDKVTDFIDESCRDVRTNDKRPVLALWGVGESNDIDLKRLSGRFRLVLIDRDVEALKIAMRRYGLTKDEAMVADVPFWSVSDDDYRMYEAMLADEAAAELVAEFIADTAERAVGSYKGRAEIFDCSVAVGLHSQLVSRFAALLYHYRDNYDEEDIHMLMSAISGMNASAVITLEDYIYHMTKAVIVYGYEAAAACESREAARICEAYDRRDIETISKTEQVEGARQLADELASHVGGDVELISMRHMVWPFDMEGGAKNYVMEFAAVRKL